MSGQIKNKSIRKVKSAELRTFYVAIPGNLLHNNKKKFDALKAG